MGVQLLFFVLFNIFRYRTMKSFEKDRKGETEIIHNRNYISLHIS